MCWPPLILGTGNNFIGRPCFAVCIVVIITNCQCRYKHCMNSITNTFKKVYYKLICTVYQFTICLSNNYGL